MRSAARVIRTMLVAALLGASLWAQAQAQARAYLDRDRVALGESATLSVESSANA